MPEVELDSFTESFFRTLFWSSTDDQGESLAQNYTVEDMDPTTYKRLVGECVAFQKAHMEKFVLGAKSAGHHFCMTRNREGAGFWDGDYVEYGDVLTTASHTFGELSPVVSVDGTIYC